jgi:hypothetical protein
MPLDQHLEAGHGEGQARLTIGPAPGPDLCEMADERQHGAHRLDAQAVLPRPALTEVEVGAVALGGLETGRTQDNQPPINLLHEPLQGVRRDLGRGTVPPHAQPPVLEPQTELAPDKPAMVRPTFPAALRGAATCTAGMEPLDRVGVDPPAHGRGSQERPRPGLLGLKETKEPGALGQAGKPRPIGARQPALAGAVAPAFEGLQPPQRDHCTGPEVGLGMFGDGAPRLIELGEQGRDTIEGAQGLLRSWPGVPLATRVEEVHDHDKKISKDERVYWFVRD